MGAGGALGYQLVDAYVLAPGWNLRSLCRRMPLLALRLRPLGSPTDDHLAPEMLAPACRHLLTRGCKAPPKVWMVWVA